MIDLKHLFLQSDFSNSNIQNSQQSYLAEYTNKLTLCGQGTVLH